MKLIRFLKVLLDAIELAIANERSMARYDGELPPAWYNDNLKRFNGQVMQTYGSNFTEDFQMLIAWSPKYRR